jgi:hypothetical protein
MFVYNLAYVIRFLLGRVLAKALDKDQELGLPYVVIGVLWVLLTVIALLSFNLGNWYFSFFYFQCSSEIKFIHRAHDDDVETQRDQMSRRNNTIFYVVAFANIVSVLLLGGVEAVQAWKFNRQWWDSNGNVVDEPLLVGSRILVGIFQMISFAVLAIATLRIRKFLVEKNMADMLNSKMMVLHVVCFLLYVCAGIAFYVSEIHYYMVDTSGPAEKRAATESLITILIAANISCFFAMIFQLLIFLRLSNIEVTKTNQ